MVLTNRLSTCGLPKLANNNAQWRACHQGVKLEVYPEGKLFVLKPSSETFLWCSAVKGAFFFPFIIIDYHHLHGRLRAYCEQGSNAFRLKCKNYTPNVAR